MQIIFWKKSCNYDQIIITTGSPPAFPILDASLMASAAAAAAAGDGTSPPGVSGDPNATTPQKYSCAQCGRSYLHQATLVRHQVRNLRDSE